MALNINKARAVSAPGLSGVSVANPVSEWERIQKNSDGTITVIVRYYETQEVLDAGEAPFDTVSYQVPEPMSMEALLQTELKNLPDFDAAT